MYTNQERITYLLQRYSANKSSAEEVKELFAWLQQAEDDRVLQEHIRDLWQQAAVENAPQETDWDGMFNRVVSTPVQQPRKRTVIPAIAATVLVLCTVAAGTVFYFNKPHDTAPQIAQHTSRHLKVQATATRQLSLPDGSTVVMHPGSTLEYTDSLSREVSLSGEAYFDVAQDARRPFVIHTGLLKTTVLGTTFNIKAYPGEKNITVTVKKGRVRVEDKEQVLGVLETDRQIIYDTEKLVARQQQVNAIAAAGWMKEDMIFDNTAFAVITAQLSERYNVAVRFKDQDLGKCPVTASFNGTEPLEEVLTVVCITRNATYTIRNGVVVIDGKGCNE